MVSEIEATDLLISSPGTKFIDMTSDCGAFFDSSKTLVVTDASFVVVSRIACVLPSTVIIFTFAGAIEPILIPALIPEAMSPEIASPSIRKFPK